MSYSNYLENLFRIKRRIDDADGPNRWEEVHFQQVQALKLLKDALRHGGLTHGEIHHLGDVVDEIDQYANERGPSKDHFLGERFA